MPVKFTLMKSKETKKLAVEIHSLSLSLPKFELYEEGSQVRRASKSVTANIMEGYTRKRYKADFIKYLTYAQAECDETIVHIDFLYETKSFKGETVYKKLKEDYDLLNKRINKFIQWVEVNFSVESKQETGN